MIARNSHERRFALPGGWLAGERLADCRRYSSAVLRPLSGYEEEWLADHRLAPSATSTSRLLDACIVRLDAEDAFDGLAGRMLVGDRDYLILQLRRLTFGERFQAVADCSACSGRMDVDFDAASVPVERGAADSATYELPLSDAVNSLRYRLPCGADQEAVLGLDVAAASAALLRRCLLDDGGMPLDANETSRVIAAMEERAPRIDLELELTCPECRHDFLLPFDITAFFLDELRTTASQLLREVHCLALYYHWNESEILGLSRDRRRAYLALLSDVRQRE